MKKQLKTRDHLTTTLRKDLAHELNQLHIKTSVPKSKLLDRAVSLLLEEHKK